MTTLHPMAEAARVVLDAMLADPEAATAILDAKHADHADTRRSLLGQYRLIADYTLAPDAMALIRADLALAEADPDRTEEAERRRLVLRALTQTDEEKSA